MPQRQPTELGELPVDWRIVPIDELRPVVTSGSRGWAVYYSESGAIFLRITNLSRSRIDPSLDDLKYVVVPEGDSEGIRTSLQVGDVLISITADIGMIGLVTPAIALPAYINQHIALVRVANEQTNSRYLAYFLAGAASQRRFKAMTDAGAKAGLNLSGIRQVLAALPPTMKEQAAIAEALSDADVLIESLSLLLAKKRQIKQGAMQELLTGTKRLPGFDMAWVETNLGSLGRTYGGLTGKTKSDFGQGQARYITFMNVMANVAMDARQTEVVDVKVGETQNSVLIGDLLFNGSSETPEEVALCSYVAEEAGPLYLNSFCFGFRPHDRDAVCGLFMAYFFRSRPGRRAISALAQGATRYNISKTALLQAPLRLPSTDEQRAIVEVLSSFDADIAAVESRVAKARDLKQGMMQELLTGRIRLVQPASNVIPLPIKPAVAHPPPPQPAHNWQINEAVVIGMLAQRFGNEKFPLPRKRRVKLMYLLHRHAEGRTEGYLKKAAGPYDPNTKYKGPEAIALKNGYVRAVHNGTYEGFVGGDKSDQAQRYFDQWYGIPSLDWLERFHYRKTDDLELLATVDMAMVDLAAAGQPANLVGVKRVIATHPEWVPKLSRELFSDDRIAGAIAECQVLFSG